MRARLETEVLRDDHLSSDDTNEPRDYREDEEGVAKPIHRNARYESKRYSASRHMLASRHGMLTHCGQSLPRDEDTGGDHQVHDVVPGVYEQVRPGALLEERRGKGARKDETAPNEDRQAER